MRIAFLTSELSHRNGNYMGGLGNVAIEMLNYLSKDDTNQYYVFSLTKNDHLNITIEQDGKIKYHWFPMRMFGELRDNNYNEFMMAFSKKVTLYIIEQYLCRNNDFFNIMHFHDWMVIPIMIRLHRLNFPKMIRILHMHSTEYARIGNQINYNDKESIYRHNLEMQGCCSADLIIPVSEVFGEEIVRLFGVSEDKVRYVDNGLDLSSWINHKPDPYIRSSIGISMDDPVILFCGRLVWQKNPQMLMEAFINTLPAHPRARLVFIGDGHMKPELEKIARKKDLFGKSIFFLGSINGKAKYDWYRTSLLVAVPSFNEPFGLIVIEALISNSPVLIPSNIAPARYLKKSPKECAYIYEPNLNDMTRVISLAIRQKEKTIEMGINGCEFVKEHFTSEIMCKKIEKIYNRFNDSAYFPNMHLLHH